MHRHSDRYQDSEDSEDFDQEAAESDPESDDREREEKLIEAERKRKEYVRSLEGKHEDPSKYVYVTVRGRHRKGGAKEAEERGGPPDDEDDDQDFDSEGKEAFPRGGRLKQIRTHFSAWQTQGPPAGWERAVLALLSSSLIAVILLFCVHYHQEVEYWRELEQVVRNERAAREAAAAAVEAVKASAAEQVEALRSRGAAAAALAPAAAALTAAPTAPCPAQPECPPAPLCSPGASAAAPAALSTMADLEAWTPDFKVYVYDLPGEFNVDLKADQRRCINDQYGTEIRIHERLMGSPLRTTNPHEAEFFFVPLYGECYLFRENQLAGKDALKNTNKWYRRALDIVSHDHPYWNRTQGRDHFFVFAGARGPHIFQDWKKHIKKAIFMTPEGDRSLSEQFNTWKDVVIPGLEPEATFLSGKNRAVPLEKRHIFAFFRGTIHHKGGQSYSKGIRIKMEERLKGVKDVVFAEQQGSCNRDCYRDAMAHAVFCLCPRGWSPWTLRAYQAMMSGCIPVVIADEIEFPFENDLDWSKLTVKISEAQAEQAVDILRQIPESVIRDKRAEIDKVWKMVSWPDKPDKADAFHAVMHDLGRKRRNFKASTFTFWN